MISTTYLAVTTISRLQKISDSTPSTASGDCGSPPVAASDCSSAYSGLVPMSPYTTPVAPMVARKDRRLAFIPAVPCRFLRWLATPAAARRLRGFGRCGGHSMVPRHCSAPQWQAQISSTLGGSERSRPME